MPEIDVEKLRVSCKRCGWSWIPRVSIVRMCPHCGSPYWDVERRVKKQKEEEVHADEN